MILDKEIKIPILTQKQFVYYKKDFVDLKLGEEIIIQITELTHGSNIKVNVKCDICGKEKFLKYCKYIQNTKSLTELYCCCQKCANEKRKQEMIEEILKINKLTS